MVRAQWDGREIALGVADVPIPVVYGDRTLAKFWAELAALVDLSHIQAKRLAKGRLAIHEEFPNSVAEAITLFLRP